MGLELGVDVCAGAVGLGVVRAGAGVRFGVVIGGVELTVVDAGGVEFVVGTDGAGLAEGICVAGGVLHPASINTTNRRLIINGVFECLK